MWRDTDQSFTHGQKMQQGGHVTLSPNPSDDADLAVFRLGRATSPFDLHGRLTTGLVTTQFELNRRGRHGRCRSVHTRDRKRGISRYTNK